jgi:hypothetical protein
MVFRYLDLVEARLSAVEVDLCRVKAQVASNQDTQPAAVTGDRSATVSFDELANEDDDVESETSPDATDGVGTIEFTTEETSAYFGNPIPCSVMPVLFLSQLNSVQARRQTLHLREFFDVPWPISCRKQMAPHQTRHLVLTCTGTRWQRPVLHRLRGILR